MSHLPSQRAAGEGTADVRYAGGEQYADDEFMFNGSIPVSVLFPARYIYSTNRTVPLATRYFFFLPPPTTTST